jgi:hypothetical protein
VLTQGVEIAAGAKPTSTGKFFPYRIDLSREVVLRVLLNLALSDKTVRDVAAHDGIRTGITHAASNTENLTSRAHQSLTNIQVRLKMVDAKGQQELMERVSEFTASQRHVMISYCWDQQEVVLRIKNSLTTRGYTCWLDVEQLSGSTVDAMADAIDHSYAVVYGISLGYKESPNCRLEAMYGARFPTAIYTRGCHWFPCLCPA